MSEQEQYLIAGKTLVEYGETKRTLAALNAKAANYAKDLRLVASTLHRDAEVRPTYNHQNWGEPSFLAAVAGFPSKEAIEELVGELKAAVKRKRELQETLRQMGYEPKEDT